MLRTRLYDLRMSRAPQAVGLCQADLKRIADMANSAQRRLLLDRSAGEEGWWGTWAEMEFTVLTANPYITTPRDVARIERVVICNEPVLVHNQFYEYIQLGNGRLPKTCRGDCYRPLQVLSRNTTPLFRDLTGKPRIIRVYPVDPQDFANRRVLIQGTDSTGVPVTSMDGRYQIQGEYVSVGSPFTDTVNQYNTITGIQKDLTMGQIQIFDVDTATGTQTQILTMEPSELTAWYRRYYLSNLPPKCCHGTTGQVTVRAIVKLDLIPATADQDYLLIGNIEALIEEMQAVRYSEMDSADAKKNEELKHANAVRLMIGECQHYLGKQDIDVRLNLFGTARLERHKIGVMI